MRIIDKTPLVDEDGSINFFNKIKGTLLYGFSWLPDLSAQQKAVDILAKGLGKKFTLIRNHTLPNSKIIIPIILIGPPGVQVIFVTHLQGSYKAKNDAWGVVSGGKFKESAINLLKRTAQLSKALDVYIKHKDFVLPDGVEPVLLSVNPALHIASVRPIVRIVLSDAVDRFASSLVQDPPVMTLEVVHKMAEELINPKPPKAKEPSPQEKKKVRKAPEENMGEIDFASDESASAPKVTPRKQRRVARPPVKKAKQDYFGMTGKQLAIIGVMGLVLVCVLISVIVGVLFFA